MKLLYLTSLVLSVLQSNADNHSCQDFAQMLHNFIQQSDDGPSVGDSPTVGSSNDGLTLGSSAHSRVDQSQCLDLVQLLYAFLQEPYEASTGERPTVGSSGERPTVGSSNDSPMVGSSAQSRADRSECHDLAQLLYAFLQGPDESATLEEADDGPTIGDGPTLGSSANTRSDQPILTALSPHHAAHAQAAPASGRHDDAENPPMLIAPSPQLIAPAPQLIAPAPQLIAAPVPPVMETAAVTGSKLFIHFYDCGGCVVDVQVYDTDTQTQVAASSVPDTAASYWTTVRGVTAGNEYLVRACVQDTQRCEDVLCPPQTQPLPGSTTGLSSCAATDVCASSSQPMCEHKHRREDRIMHILRQLLQ